MSGTMTAESFKAAQKAQWGAVASGWDRWNTWYEATFRPLTEWCCNATALRPGMRVLDLACGTGQPALAAAARVAPGGSVLAVDIAPEMVAVAARRAREAGHAQMTCREMDAERLDLPDASVDAVTCACGFMFLPDPAGALAEIRRVLKPGGRVAIGVWDDPSRSPFLTMFGQALAKVAPAPLPDPTAPGPFRFAAPGVLAAVLTDAGFTRVHVESLPMAIVCDSVEDYWAKVVDHAAGLEQRLSSLPAADLARVRELVTEGLAPFAGADGRLLLAATPLCGAATR